MKALAISLLLANVSSAPVFTTNYPYAAPVAYQPMAAPMVAPYIHQTHSVYPLTSPLAAYHTPAIAAYRAPAVAIAGGVAGVPAAGGSAAEEADPVKK